MTKDQQIKALQAQVGELQTRIADLEHFSKPLSPHRQMLDFEAMRKGAQSITFDFSKMEVY